LNGDRLSKLDDAFLFIVSFVGLLITIVQASIFGANVKSLLEILPLLFLGMGIPLYIGYFRGAISIAPVNHSVAERMRGWIYLIMGVGGYFGFMFSHGAPSQIDRWIILYSIAVVGLNLAFIMQRWFIDVFDVGESLSHQYSFFGTITSAFLLSFVFRMFVSLVSDLSAVSELPPFSMFLLAFFVWMTWGSLMMSFVWEKISRNIVSAVLPLNISHIQKRSSRNFTMKLLLLNTDIYRFVFTENTNLQAYVAWLMGIVLGTLGCLLIVIPVLGFGFLLASIFFTGLGTYSFCRMDKIDFSEFRHACTYR